MQHLSKLIQHARLSDYTTKDVAVNKRLQCTNLTIREYAYRSTCFVQCHNCSPKLKRCRFHLLRKDVWTSTASVRIWISEMSIGVDLDPDYNDFWIWIGSGL